MKCKVELHYLYGEDVLTQCGTLVPIGGPFSDCLVLEVDDTHVVFSPDKVVKIVVEDMPEFFLIEEEHLHMMREMRDRQLFDAHAQVEESSDNDGVYFA